MRTFDRATYLVFLLVLLADVACAQGPAPVGLDATGGLILSAAAPARVIPAAGVVRATQGTGQLRSVKATRVFRTELSYRAGSKMGCAVHLGAVRNLFDGSSFGMAVNFAALPGTDTETAFVPPLKVDAPTIPVVEHTGSPAP
jgi:hypothetical protein